MEWDYSKTWDGAPTQAAKDRDAAYDRCWYWIQRAHRGEAARDGALDAAVRFIESRKVSASQFYAEQIRALDPLQ